MAKRKDVATPPNPSDEVRYTGKMSRADRARFRYFCDRMGLDMERVGPAWIMERLAQEEGHAPPRPRK